MLKFGTIKLLVPNYESIFNGVASSCVDNPSQSFPLLLVFVNKLFILGW